MKLRASFITLIVLVLIPCSAALLAQGIIPGIANTTAAILGTAWIIKFMISPSPIKKRFPTLVTLHGGCVMVRTYRVAVTFHIIALFMLKTLLHIMALPTVIYIVSASLLGLLAAFGGMLRLIIKSTQISMTLRVLLIMLWWIPLVNLPVLRRAEKTAWLEFDREAALIELDNARAENEVCKTKYPILMVHGIFFRDSNFFNYWGRIPKELIKNGAVVYYGRQCSAASVEVCAQELRLRILEILATTGCEKVNIIAHSKGGLDSRLVASYPDMQGCIASITTVNTPHNGCEYADFLIEHAPPAVLKFIASKYDSALAHLGEDNSDFAAGVNDLTASRCRKRNEALPLPEGVLCQSVGSYMKKSRSAGFPLNFAYLLVRLFSKSPNDGLVDINSMRWGSSFTLFEPKTKRGISHGDMIDLFREDISGFDVREEYVTIAKNLKSCGL